MCQIPFLSQLYLCAPVCWMLNYLFWWILCRTGCSQMFQLSFSNALSYGVQSLPFSQNFFHRAHKSFELTLRLSPIFQENCDFVVFFFIFEASVHSYWQISHWMLFSSLCFFMWLLYWLAPFPFSPHNLHWKGMSLCILYWCSPNFSWLGNLFEHMLQTQSILMLEIILHNWLKQGEVRQMVSITFSFFVWK